jgi:pyrroline-5-carboxylate reductase
MQIGFIGTGTIAAAMVTGLQTIGPAPPTLVSPRSETLSRALADRFPNVRRAASNAEVAKADMVVLAMRPAQLEEALAGIRFGAGQLVVSLVAGLALEAVQRLAPQSRVDRAIPMPGIARGEGPIAVYPGLPETVELLRPLGDLVVAPTEAAMSMGGINAFMSTYFELQGVLIARAMSAGVTEADARLYVTSLLSMLAGTARSTPPDRFGDLVIEHQTKGGLNERVRANLLATGWFDAPAKAFDEIVGLSWKKLG